MTARRAGRLAAAASAGALLLAGCGSAGPARLSAGAPPAASLTAPLTVSTATADDAWVLVPMGHLDDPLNTFWELFVLPTATGRFVLATPTGVADNGGLVAAGAHGQALTVGFRPSQLLTLSPLTSTVDAGRTYTPGFVPVGLADVPDALSVAASGGALALSDQADPTVEASPAGLTNWSALVSQSSLATAAGAAGCAPKLLTGVADTGAAEYVAAACGRPGVAGVYQLSAGTVTGDTVTGDTVTGDTVTADTPPLPASERRQEADVVRITSSGAGLAVVIRLLDGGRTAGYQAAWQRPGRGWVVSGLLATSARLLSTGSTAGGGFDLLTGPANRPGLHVIEPDGTWQSLASPPAGTAAVAVGAHTVESVSVGSTRFTSYRLDPATGVWTQTQTASIPVPFGTSN